MKTTLRLALAQVAFWHSHKFVFYNLEHFFQNQSKKKTFKDEEHIKKNCEWIKVTHDPLNNAEINELVIFSRELFKIF